MSNQPDIKQKVLEKIHAGTVTIRPRFSFILRNALIGVAATTGFFIALFVFSFALFSVRRSGMHYLLSFGKQGLPVFISLFPWASLGLFLLVIIGLELVMRRFTAAYRFSLLRIFGWILLLGIAGGALLDTTQIHAHLLSAADENRLPVLGPFYERVHESHQAEGVFRGNVIDISTSTITISHDDDDRDTDEGSSTVVLPANAGTSTFTVGDKVYVGGHWEDGVVHAFGVENESKGSDHGSRGKNSKSNNKHGGGDGGHNSGGSNNDD